MMRYLGRPIVSTSANLAGIPTPKSFKEIDEAVLKGVDYVVNLHRQKNGGNPSTIIKLSNSGGVKIIRE